MSIYKTEIKKVVIAQSLISFIVGCGNVSQTEVKSLHQINPAPVSELLECEGSIVETTATTSETIAVSAKVRTVAGDTTAQLFRKESDRALTEPLACLNGSVDMWNLSCDDTATNRPTGFSTYFRLYETAEGKKVSFTEYRDVIGVFRDGNLECRPAGQSTFSLSQEKGGELYEAMVLSQYVNGPINNVRTENFGRVSVVSLESIECTPKMYSSSLSQLLDPSCILKPDFLTSDSTKLPFVSLSLPAKLKIYSLLETAGIKFELGKTTKVEGIRCTKDARLPNRIAKCTVK